MSEILIYDEAGTFPKRDDKKLRKKIKDILDRMNPSRKIFALGERHDE